MINHESLDSSGHTLMGCPVQNPNCNGPQPTAHPNPTATPAPYPYSPTGESFTVHNGVYTITVSFANGTSATATSMDGGDTFSIPLAIGGTQLWRFEFIRDKNNNVALVAQLVSSSVGNDRRYPQSASQDAACAFAGVLGGALGSMIGRIVGQSVGAELGAIAFSELGPVGIASGIVIGYNYGGEIGQFLGLSIGTALATYACSAFYETRPTPTPFVNYVYNPNYGVGPYYDGGSQYGIPDPIYAPAPPVYCVKATVTTLNGQPVIQPDPANRTCVTG